MDESGTDEGSRKVASGRRVAGAILLLFIDEYHTACGPCGTITGVIYM